MGDRRIGVIINGATGRMGTTQHMANLLAIAAEGGLKLENGDRLIPNLLLVGRDAGRLAKLAAAHDDQRWTTNLAEALAGPDQIFMDTVASLITFLVIVALATWLPAPLLSKADPTNANAFYQLGMTALNL